MIINNLLFLFFAITNTLLEKKSMPKAYSDDLSLQLQFMLSRCQRFCNRVYIVILPIVALLHRQLDRTKSTDQYKVPLQTLGTPSSLLLYYTVKLKIDLRNQGLANRLRNASGKSNLYYCRIWRELISIEPFLPFLY